MHLTSDQRDLYEVCNTPNSNPNPPTFEKEESVGVGWEIEMITYS